MYLFKSHEPSIFIKQLFYKKHVEENEKRQAESKAKKVSVKATPYGKVDKQFSEEEYNKFVYNLAEGVIVSHKKYGQGVVTNMDETTIRMLEDAEKFYN